MSGISQTFGPLCEGFAGSGHIEVAYVQQGDKVCVVLGERSLCESIDDALTLVESIDQLELEERTVGGKTFKAVKEGRWFVEGPFQRSDVRNANKRTYPRVIWEKHVGDQKSHVQKNVKEGGMLGHLEHPKDGRTDGNEGSLVTRKLDLQRDGTVWGVAELLDTPKGLILQEYTRKGVRWGVSSRGNGSVDDTGRVSEADYVLEAFDAVMKPSTPGAYPKVTDKKNESQDEAVLESDEAPTQQVNEAVTALNGEITALCETDLVGLDPRDRLAFTKELVAGLNKVSSLEGSSALSHERATDLRDWLTKKLQSVNEAEEVEQAIGSATEEDADGQDEAAEAFKRVVESLQARLNAAVQETAAKDEALQQTKRRVVAVEHAAAERIARIEAARDEAVVEAQARATAVSAELDEAQNELVEARSLLQRKESELVTARSLVTDTSTVEIRNPVDEAVTDALRGHEDLAEFEDVLRAAQSPEQVKALVERLSSGTRTTPVPLARRSLPRGVLVESDADAGKRSAATNPSKGARMAGAVVKKMTNGKP